MYIYIYIYDVGVIGVAGQISKTFTASQWTSMSCKTCPKFNLFIYLLIYSFFEVVKFTKFTYAMKKIVAAKFCHANLRQLPI